MDHIRDIERQIAGRIVADAIAAGYYVSVHDGEGFALRHSTDAAAILAAMASTDADVLFIYRENHNPIGWVQLIWGNGWDVVSDHSDNTAMCDFLAGANKLSDELQEAELRAVRVGKRVVVGDTMIYVHGEIAPGLFFCRVVAFGKANDGAACLHDGDNFRGFIERADGKRFRIRVWDPLGSAKRGDCTTGLYFTESGAERALMRIGKELHLRDREDCLEAYANSVASELTAIELAAAGGLQ